MSDVSKKELVEELRKHEQRETPAQEAAESKEEQEIERKAGVEKKAFEGGFFARYNQSYRDPGFAKFRRFGSGK